MNFFSLRAICLSLAVCSLLIAPAQAASRSQATTQNEQAKRSILIEHIRMMRLNGKLDEVERLANEFRSSQSRTDSGVWKLSLLYTAMAEHAYLSAQAGASTVISAAWKKHGRRWLADYSRSPTPHIAKAVELLTEAWRIRGNGYAKDVWPDAWKGFLAKLNEAADILKSSRHFASADPHWYTIRIRIAMARGEGIPKILGLFREAVGKNKYYYPTYFAVVKALHPKWGGSWKLVDDFVDWSVKETEEKEGQSLFARLQWVQYGDPRVTEKFKDNQVFWPRMKTAIKSLIAQYPVQHNLMFHNGIACKAHNERAVTWLIQQRHRLGGVAISKEPTDPALFCNWK